MMSSFETSSPVSACLLVDLIEADFFGIGSGRVQSDRAGDEGKAQKAFPVGARGHWVLQTQRGTGGLKTILEHWFLQSSFKKFTLQSCSIFVLIGLRCHSTTENEVDPLVRRKCK